MRNRLDPDACWHCSIIPMHGFPSSSASQHITALCRAVTPSAAEGRCPTSRPARERRTAARPSTPAGCSGAPGGAQDQPTASGGVSAILIRIAARHTAGLWPGPLVTVLSMLVLNMVCTAYSSWEACKGKCMQLQAAQPAIPKKGKNNNSSRTGDKRERAAALVEREHERETY